MTAIKFADEIEEFDIFWFEEPCPTEFTENLTEIRDSINIPTVTGEALYTKNAFIDVFGRKSADIINPDVTTNRWIIESNTKYLNKASARSFKGELEAEIVVDISEQRLYLVKNKKILKSYPISSPKYGEGSIQNSFKTPLGMHEIRTKIGHDAKENTIFVARANTNKSAKIIKDVIDTEDDHVTSRILWLDGLELGRNKGEGIDSYNRYIYIHGTHEEGLIGQKASHGCIRMFNNDVIDLFERVQEGTYVLIKA